eukprot:TRINITY_DN2572_c0_g1_i1.p1 TRINITY_DN2572_c0_g1~~TRINITY_DN2572_c0_g1_i1.p1  ORF type:complete len:481 (+),score=74.29 TRINITY_DN2572_c0_g1_i1:102-1544(+)
MSSCRQQNFSVQQSPLVNTEIETDSMLGKYRLGRVLGGGAYGLVRVAFDTEEQEVVAMKMVQRGSEVTKTKYLKREVMNHRRLNHPHVVSMYKVLLSQKNLCMVMEFIDGEDLHSYVKRNGPLNESTARWFFQQQVLGLDYIHRMGVVNRDIKLENCLVCQPENMSKPILKLCDFGFSKMNGVHSSPKSRVGTLQYMAPEVVEAACIKQNNIYDGKAADVWSCGTMLYAMLFKKFPFFDSKIGKDKPNQNLNKQQIQEVVFKRIREASITIPESVSPECVDLLTRMLDRNPNTRITVPEIMKHPWFMHGLPEGFQNFNISTVEAQLSGEMKGTCEQEVVEIDALVAASAQLEVCDKKQRKGIQSTTSSMRQRSTNLADTKKLQKLVTLLAEQQETNRTGSGRSTSSGGHLMQPRVSSKGLPNNKSSHGSPTNTEDSAASAASAERAFRKRAASVKLPGFMRKKIFPSAALHIFQNNHNQH